MQLLIASLLLAGNPLLELLQYDWDLKPLLPLDLEGSGGGFLHRDLPVFELLKQSGFFTWDFFICQSLNIKQQMLSCSCYLHVSGSVSIWGKEIERMMLWVKLRGEKVLVVLNMISARSTGVTLRFSVKLKDLVSKRFCCSYEQSQDCSSFQRRVWAGVILYDIFVN